MLWPRRYLQLPDVYTADDSVLSSYDKGNTNLKRAEDYLEAVTHRLTVAEDKSGIVYYAHMCDTLLLCDQYYKLHHTRAAANALIVPRLYNGIKCEILVYDIIDRLYRDEGHHTYMTTDLLDSQCAALIEAGLYCQCSAMHTHDIFNDLLRQLYNLLRPCTVLCHVWASARRHDILPLQAEQIGRDVYVRAKEIRDCNHMENTYLASYRQRAPIPAWLVEMVDACLWHCSSLGAHAVSVLPSDVPTITHVWPPHDAASPWPIEMRLKQALLGLVVAPQLQDHTGHDAAGAPYNTPPKTQVEDTPKRFRVIVE